MDRKLKSLISTDIHLAAHLLHQGGIIAYPTEAVFGLGCDPKNHDALTRLIALKQRSATKGFVLIAAEFSQLAPFLDLRHVTGEQLKEAFATWPGPFTWVFPVKNQVDKLLTGMHQSLAIRLTAHPLAQALCHAFDGAIISTSANLEGSPPARSVAEVQSVFLDQLDLIVDGPLGDAAQPTPIRDVRTGKQFR